MFNRFEEINMADQRKIDEYNSHGANIPGFKHLTNFSKDKEYIYEMTIDELTRNQDDFIISRASNKSSWKGLYVRRGLGDLSWFWNEYDRIGKEMSI